MIRHDQKLDETVHDETRFEITNFDQTWPADLIRQGIQKTVSSVITNNEQMQSCGLEFRHIILSYT
jgi:hypothetical protein